MTLVVSAVILTVWLVVGFVLWIPFIVRMMGAYFGHLIISVYSQHDLKPAQLALDNAVGFYARGFRLIIRNLKSATVEPAIVTHIAADKIGQILLDLLFAILFWMTTLFAVGMIASSLTKTIAHDLKFGTKTGSLSWETSTLFGQKSQYKIDITPDQIALRQYRRVFLVTSAVLRMKVCNTGLNDIASTTIYVWYEPSNSDSTVRWTTSLDKLSKAMCVVYTVTMDIADFQFFYPVTGTFKFSVRPDQVFSDLQVQRL
jgi:hypothetical protein